MVVAVKVVVAVATEQLVVTAGAARDPANRILVANERAVVARAAVDHVVTGVAGDLAGAGKHATVADQESVSSGTAVDRVIAVMS